jgi:RNA polymerase sigma-70 factor, ECF subfamily
MCLKKGPFSGISKGLAFLHQLFDARLVLMSENDDLEIVRKCQDGDRKAFELLVDRYQKQIFNVALRMTKNYADAEDIAQTTFVKTYESIRSFDPKYKFFSWIYRIVVNESLNHVHQRKYTEELNEEIVAPEKTLEERFDEDQTSARVQDALMQMKEDHRTVIVLKHLQGLSYEEISEILEIPEKKVKSRLFTARLVLKDVLLSKGLERNE